MASVECDDRYLLARRHLVAERNREELDEVSSMSCHVSCDHVMSCHVSCDQVSNRRLSSMAGDVASGLAFLHDQK